MLEFGRTLFTRGPQSQSAALVLTALAFALVTCSVRTSQAQAGQAQADRAQAKRYEFPDVDDLPVQESLPDPFVMGDGSRVQNRADWNEQRTRLKVMLAHYQYGHMPPRPSPDQVSIEERASKRIYGGTAVETIFRIRITRNGKSAAFQVGLRRPLRADGPHRMPVIIKNAGFLFDLSAIQDSSRRAYYQRHRRGALAEFASREALRRGYVFCKFIREEVAPDDVENRQGGVLALYPEYDWGAIAAWAWAYQVIIDVLEGEDYIDATRVVATGHSRGGKAALSAGIYDERIAVTAPNSSGSGGTGSWRFFDAEHEPQTLAYHKERFQHWWSPHLFQFADHVERLPFDAHFAKALIAPRALLNTHAREDYWANPYGTYLTYLAAQPVFEWLGVGAHQAVHWRPGGHNQAEPDWLALFDYCDMVFFGKETPHVYDANPHPAVYNFEAYVLPSPPS